MHLQRSEIKRRISTKIKEANRNSGETKKKFKIKQKLYTLERHGRACERLYGGQICFPHAYKIHGDLLMII